MAFHSLALPRYTLSFSTATDVSAKGLDGSARRDVNEMARRREKRTEREREVM